MRRAELYVSDQLVIPFGNANLECRVVELFRPIRGRMILQEDLKVGRLVEMAERIGKRVRTKLGQGFGVVRSGLAIDDRHGSSPATPGQFLPVIAITLNKRPIWSSSQSRRRAADMLSVSAGFFAAKAIARAAMPKVSNQVPWLVTLLGRAPSRFAASARAAKST